MSLHSQTVCILRWEPLPASACLMAYILPSPSMHEDITRLKNSSFSPLWPVSVIGLQDRYACILIWVFRAKTVLEATKQV